MEINNKRNALLTVLFSIISPGLGHIYNGKLLRGIVLYGILILIITLPTFILYHSIIGYFLGMLFQALMYIFILIDCIIINAKIANYNIKKYNKWFIYILVIILNILMFFFLKDVFFSKISRFQPMIVASRSNEPNLIRKDRVMMDKWFYFFHDLRKNDFVVFLNPDYAPNSNSNEKYINKRCVGLPGDKIEIKNFQLYVNDNLISGYDVKIENDQVLKQQLMINLKLTYGDNYENVMKNNPELLEEPENYRNFGPIIVPENSFFALGDNRTNSMDSRNYGSINFANIHGKIKYVYMSDDFNRIGRKF